jgi:protein-S-isoprenylcysteine O-methyltransferase Ste14
LYDSSWFLDPRFIAGTALFFTGLWIHIRSDNILRSLRPPGESGYKVPVGGLYRYVSAPNYFGEIVQWFGWALATWSPAGLAFAAFTVANLLPRGIAHHRWYKEYFPDYPEDRKAVIPLVL